MNTALQAPLQEVRLDLIAAIGAVRPDVRSQCCSYREHLPASDCHARSVAHHVTAHELVPAVHADVVLVAE